MMRQETGLSVSRFCEIAGIPRASWYRRAGRAADELPAHGPWPAPVREAIEQPAAQLALEWPAWGHRKIHALLRRGEHVVGYYALAMGAVWQNTRCAKTAVAVEAGSETLFDYMLII
jgi:hypothetical protein